MKNLSCRIDIIIVQCTHVWNFKRSIVEQLFYNKYRVSTLQTSVSVYCTIFAHVLLRGHSDRTAPFEIMYVIGEVKQKSKPFAFFSHMASVELHKNYNVIHCIRIFS